MDIGRPKRIIEIDPISLPVPAPELPSPVTEPMRARATTAHARGAGAVSPLPLAGDLQQTTGLEPILAWRTWALTGHRDGTDLLLRPVAGRSRPWKPMQPVEAACKHARMHAAPHIECTCGLHGTMSWTSCAERAALPSWAGSPSGVG
jgi:hypothetical protein